ncbi:MAG: PQQ-binding-like beta-propeller repeat protein [Acidimicrobiales bacterium]|nr:PQQ-binding-like beta-propeller repeat protein [Acidimicrobiales bacterium]
MRPLPPLLPIALVCVLVIAGTWWIDDRGSADVATDDPDTETAGEVDVATDDTTTTTAAPYDGWSDPARAGEPWPDASVEGLLTFRGNPTRSWYGAGPVSKSEPEVAFRFPETGGMCGESTNLGETKVWCGMGWTGQPAVFERNDRTWVVFGAYDGAVHFVDADSGERILPDFPTGDLIKGSVTIDPDGFPLVYTGSRDNEFRILSIEGDEAVERWSMHADDFSPVLWNDDWDSSAMVIDDYLFVGGENSRFFILKLNRAYDADGNVTVDPEIVFNVASWDEELLSAIGDETVSVEVSPTVVGDTVYFANSGGLVQGYDIDGLADGETPERTFRFWTGDDTDASIVADDEGMLYVASEYERAGTASRSDEVGQLIKLDPSADVEAGEDPLVWSFFDNEVRPGGMWATPAVVDGVVYAATDGGELLGVAADTGEELWSIPLPGPVWGSPVVVDDVLLIGDCNGVFHAFDVSEPGVEPTELWSKELGGCIEATPAVWDGRIYIGSRDGALYSLGGPAEPATPTP